MKKIQIKNYLLEIPDYIPYQLIEESDYTGISLTYQSYHYEIIYNKHLGTRLLINNLGQDILFSTTFTCKDVPFNEGTFWFLPEDINLSIVL